MREMHGFVNKLFKIWAACDEKMTGRQGKPLCHCERSEAISMPLGAAPPVMPVKTGIQTNLDMDSRLRGNDEGGHEIATALWASR